MDPARSAEQQGNALLRQHNFIDAAYAYMRAAILATSEARDLESARKNVGRLTLKIARALERGASSSAEEIRALEWYECAVAAYPDNRRAYRMYSSLRRRLHQK